MILLRNASPPLPQGREEFFSLKGQLFSMESQEHSLSVIFLMLFLKTESISMLENDMLNQQSKFVALYL